jgi:predicted ATP-dependent endonuclease of OLD family
MKLAEVTLRDFKSIRCSETFKLDQITCLVGKNESGKTALLQALYRLNPVVPEHGKYDVTEDFPRSDVEEYRQALEAKLRQPAVVVQARFELDDAEVSEIEAVFGKAVLRKPEAVLTRGYTNDLGVVLDLDEKAVVTGLVTASAMPDAVARQASKAADLKELIQILHTRAETQTKEFNEAQAQANAITDPVAKQKALETAKLLAESPHAQALRGRLPEIDKQGIREYIWNTFLKKRFPKFLYFDEYYQMEGHVNIEQLKQRQQQPGQLKDSDRPMLGLIELARLNLDQLTSPKNTEALISKLEGASNYLSKQILKYWSQNKHIQIKFDVRQALPEDPEGMRSGTNVWGRVHDSVHQVSTRLGTRSRGFVWFFSFLAWFSQQRKHGHPLILLLDEPGLVLHASAQSDLLRYFEEELGAHHQLVYTTHSPFMIDPHHFERVRLVEDRSMSSDAELPIDTQGTKVSDDVLEAEEGTLFPLQGALGYDIAQTLFLGPNTLIVEGVSDLWYLQMMSALLEEHGRAGLSPKWTITPVGGAERVPAFAALVGSQSGMNVATLIDFDRQHQQRVENLYKSRLLKKTHVRTFAEFTGSAEADVEDMFDVDFYLRLVNREFGKHLDVPLESKVLTGASARILVRLDSHFAAHPLKDGVRFNHYRPARFLVENMAVMKPDISNATLERFAEAFTALNSLLA